MLFLIICHKSLPEVLAELVNYNTGLLVKN